MKGLYIIWPDMEMIDKAVQSGIDTIVVANAEYPYGTYPNHWGRWDDCERVLEKYRDHPVKIVFAPVWVPYWEDLPLNQSFHDGNRYWRRTPCPTSELFVKNRIEPAVKIANRFNASLGFDFEGYGHRTINLYNRSVWKRKKCKCSRCHKLSAREQYKVQQKNIRNYTSGLRKREIFIFPYKYQWVMKMFPKDFTKHFMTEATYSGDGGSKQLNAFWNKLFGIRTSAGIWTEQFSESRVLKEIEHYKKKWVYKGYWLYSQMNLSRYSWFRTRDDYGSPYEKRPFTKLFSDAFFRWLKTFNHK
jgi:hypothetical protein